VTGFEGAVPNAARTVQGEESITNFCKKIVEAAKKVYLYKSNHEFIISAGGSAYFDIVARELSQFKEPKILLLRSGGYVHTIVNIMKRFILLKIPMIYLSLQLRFGLN